MEKANPTTKTQKNILGVLKNNKAPMSLTEISKRSNCSIYQTHAVIKFFESLGLVRVVTSSGGTNLVFYIAGDKNGEQMF